MAKFPELTFFINSSFLNTLLDLIFSNFKSSGSSPVISLKVFDIRLKLISEFIIAILAALILVFAKATSVFDKIPASNSASAELYLFIIEV